MHLWIYFIRTEKAISFLLKGSMQLLLKTITNLHQKVHPLPEVERLASSWFPTLRNVQVSASNAKRLSTATGICGIGVVKLETPTYQGITVVKLHAKEVQQRLSVAHHFKVSTVIHDHVTLRDIGLFLKVHMVAHSRASPRTNTNPQENGGYIPASFQVLQVTESIISQGNWLLTGHRPWSYPKIILSTDTPRW